MEERSSQLIDVDDSYPSSLDLSLVVFVAICCMVFWRSLYSCLAFSTSWRRKLEVIGGRTSSTHGFQHFDVLFVLFVGVFDILRRGIDTLDQLLFQSNGNKRFFKEKQAAKWLTECWHWDLELCFQLLWPFVPLHRSISALSSSTVLVVPMRRLLARRSVSFGSFVGDRSHDEQISWERRNTEKVFNLAPSRSVCLWNTIPVIGELFVATSQIQFFDLFLGMSESQRSSVKAFHDIVHVKGRWTRMNRSWLNRLLLDKRRRHASSSIHQARVFCAQHQQLLSVRKSKCSLEGFRNSIRRSIYLQILFEK